MRDKILHLDLNDCIMRNMENICEQTDLQPPDFTGWDSLLGPKVGMTNDEFLIWAYKTPSTQLQATPHLGCPEKIRELVACGWKVYIVTATCLSVSQIIAWLDKYNIPFNGIIKTKSKLSPHLLIDDNPKTLIDRMERGLPTKKFNQRWNDDVDCPGIANWGELKL